MSKKNKTKDPEGKLEDKEFQNEESLDTEVVEEIETDALENLQSELDREKERYLRLFAEFENYKKRTTRERIEMFKTAGEGVMSSLLPVLDDFERALKELEKGDDDGLFKGVQLISNKLRETLRTKGLEDIEVKPGDTFDVEFHEAITQIPAPEAKLKGKIIDVVERGYMLGDKIVRYPKVVIGQ